MKFLFDALPVILFFIAYKFLGIYIATFIAIVVALIQVLVFWLKFRRFERMQMLMLLLIVVFGGLTLFFHNEMFIKWKPTAINWLLAAVFLGSHFVGDKPLIQRTMEKNIELPPYIWSRLSISWVIFFTLMGLINLYVVYYFDTNTWVNFKLFGMLGLTIVFTICQGGFLLKHMSNADSPRST